MKRENVTKKALLKFTSSKIAVAYVKTYKKHISIFLCVLSIVSIGVFFGLNNGGLKAARYYTNAEWKGNPAVKRIDRLPYLEEEAGYNLLATDIFSVKWKGWIAINRSGTYKFATNSDDGSYLRIDGKTVVDNGGAHGLKKVSGEIYLEKGTYPIEVLYFQAGGPNFMQTLWTPPGESENSIPAETLFSKRPKITNLFLTKGIAIISRTLQVLWGSLFILTGGIFLIIFRKNSFLWIGILCAITFWVTYFSPVDYTESDPLGSLLTSQAILEHGTIKLDVYQEELQGYSWQIEKRNEHYYYHYPPGTPLYSIPFVWLANLFGEDMSRREDDAALQNTLSAITVTLSCFLIYLICRCYVNTGYSLLITSAFVFGSSLTSTMGTGLWNMNFALIFILLSLLLLVYNDCQKIRGINPYLLGFLLFSAYLCRPTAALFVFVIFLYMLLKACFRYTPVVRQDTGCVSYCHEKYPVTYCIRQPGFLKHALLKKRPLFVRTVITYLACFGLFVLFSRIEYKQVLPDYYLPQQLGPPGEFWWAIYGHFLSPSRGLLIQSSYLILTLIGAIYGFKHLARNRYFWIAVGWSGLHLILIARNNCWYGGGSFGTRMFTEAFPAFVLLTLLVWSNVFVRLPSLLRWIALCGFIMLTGASAFINTYQGLYNIHTSEWNFFPTWHVPANEYLFDWKYPQFLANPQNLAARNLLYSAKVLSPYAPGDKITPDSPDVIFNGWSRLKESEYGSFRVSEGVSVEVLFRVESFNVNPQEHLNVEILLGSHQEQQVTILVNGREVGSIVTPKQLSPPTTYTFPVDPSTLKFVQNKKGEPNEIAFVISEPASFSDMSENKDTRAPGIGVWQIRVYTENSK